MNVWLCIPSCNPERARKCFSAWKAQGYKTMVFIDAGDDRGYGTDEVVQDIYLGYWAASNRMAKLCVKELEADLVVWGGDDIMPDPNMKADEIALDFFDHFLGYYGVMQPTGDDFGKDAAGVPAAARICGSPWLGRDWVLRAYGGKGPAWTGYTAFFGDQELKDVSESQHVLWRRPDLTQRHDHWTRPGCEPKTDYQARNNKYWNTDKELYERRKAAGFPGSAPLEKGLFT